jgi:hypothetical protein
MNNGRFEFRIPTERRQELAALASEVGLSSADLVRLGIKYLLDNRELLLRPETIMNGGPRA